MIKNIIFDFDGTLVDTAPLIVATMQAAIAELGLEARTDAECRATIGLRLEEIPSVLWPGGKVGGEMLGGAGIQISFNVSNAMAAALGGIVIRHGFGLASPALVGVPCAVIGAVVLYVLYYGEKHGRYPEAQDTKKE